MIYIYPYKFASRSAKILARALRAVRIRNDSYIARFGNDLLVNWGRSSHTRDDIRTLNKSSAVANAVDKVVALQKMKQAGVRTVEFTTDHRVAEAWQQTHEVYCRMLTRASGGKGIIITDVESTSLPDAPLYTKGVRSQGEYRVHVFNGEVIDYTKKIPNITVTLHADKINYKICSHQNGWTFARNIKPRESIKKQAIMAVQALGLDFGAVDIILNEQDKPVVLEVNTSPGLVGRTLQSYVVAITNYINSNEFRNT